MTTITPTANRSSKAWYREPWPWMLMSGPLVVIVAGIITAWLTIKSNDGLVSEDYYKQGLAAGQTVAKSKYAEDLGIVARLSLTSEGMRIKLSGKHPDMVMPTALQVTLSHPTRAGMDQISRLQQGGGDSYAGAMHLPASGHWLVLIEDEAKTWRLLGSVMLPAAQELIIGGETATTKPK
jgi:uncharacterized protein